MRTVIAGGRLIDPANGIDRVRDLYLAQGRVVAIGKAPQGFTAQRVIDAAGQWVLPGLVDLAARLREPGFEHKATVASEARAAVAGGITTLCCPPDTDPVIDNPAVAELIHQRAGQAGGARVLTLGALTQGLKGERPAEFGALQAMGCPAVSNAQRPLADTEVLRRALEYAATCAVTVFLHPEDAWLSRGQVHEGPVGSRLGLSGIPETAETVALARDLLLVEQTGVRAHICRLSSARGAAMVAEAKARGLPVSADVAIHQLHLSDADVGYFDAAAHVRPPLRSPLDRHGLRRALAEGVVDCLCSDHQPHDRDAKTGPFGATEPGISSLETLLPLTLALVEAGLLKRSQAVAALTCAPAAVLGIDAGHLGVGARADLCLVDPDRRWVLEAGSLHSRGKNTPFLGQELKGRITATLVGGRQVFKLR